MKREAVLVFIIIVIASSFLSVFTDAPKVGEELCGISKGFWKTNAEKDLSDITRKKGNAQVDKKTYLGILDCVNSEDYAGDIDDWLEWKIGSPAVDADLEWALHWLSYGEWDPIEDDWTKPKAKNPQVKARGQLLALLLTACYRGTEYTDASISVPGYNNGEWQTVLNWISDIIGYYNEGDYDGAHYIANYLNEHCAQPYIY